MAKETKVEQVHPSDVDATIERWSNFGWELMGAPQEIYNKDTNTRLERRGDTIYNVTETETTHYFRITFQRDKLMRNYSELASLESRYYALPGYPRSPDKPKKFGFFWSNYCNFDFDDNNGFFWRRV